MSRAALQWTTTPTQALSPASTSKPGLLTIGEAARLVGMSVPTLRRHITEGGLRPYATHGRAHLYLSTEVEALFATEPAAPVEKGLHTAAEVATMAGVQLATVGDWVRARKLAPWAWDGAVPLFHHRDIAALLDRPLAA